MVLLFLRHHFALIMNNFTLALFVPKGFFAILETVLLRRLTGPSYPSASWITVVVGVWFSFLSFDLCNQNETKVYSLRVVSNLLVQVSINCHVPLFNMVIGNT